jgi:ASC-1-like (ASCH) protein
VAYDAIKTIQPGERIELLSRADSQIIRVQDVRKYSSFEDMLKVEQAERIAPGTTLSELRNLLRDIYPPHKEQPGVIVLEVAAER